MRSTLILFIFSFCICARAQIISTYAGNGLEGNNGDNALATDAQLNAPDAISFDSHGSLYICSYYGQNIRKVDAETGIITSVVGTGVGGFSGDGGPANQAQINYPTGVTIDDSDNLFFSDATNQRIRKVDALTGIIHTIAGNGSGGYSGDGGLAINASFKSPWGLAFDNYHNLFIADHSNHAIRKITSDGIITTVAGNSTLGFSGDNGPADLAQLHFPSSVAFDKSYNLYIADQYNNRIRVVNAVSGIITTFVGNGDFEYNGDSVLQTDCAIYPWAIAFDNSGILYFSDMHNQRVRKISNGFVLTVAGTGMAGFSGDNGDPLNCQIYNSEGIAFDHCGNLYESETGNNRIRKITYQVCDTEYTNEIQNIAYPTATISPNPAITEINITSSSSINNVAIINPLSKLVYQHTYDVKKVSIGVANLPKGVYFVKINQQYVQRLVKE